ncbi:MAG: hypothetical protein J6O41_07635 [Clostridia bacterium]|nr:hypothetical protein [Clostridia bacterium]
MTMEEKKAIAKKFYDKLGLTNYNLEVERDNEINADFVCVPDMRGPGGLIIGDNGDYLFCQSMHDFNYWKEEYKKGTRTSTGTDDSLKLSNGKYAEDQETKEAFEGYMSKVDKYNEQVANGEKPDVKMEDLLNEYSDTFYDEALEEKKKKIEEDFNNRQKDTRIDDLIDSVNEKLKDKEEPKFLKCPICGDNLMYMQPDSTTLCCRKCNKYFKNNNGVVGEEASYPYTDPNTDY